MHYPTNENFKKSLRVGLLGAILGAIIGGSFYIYAMLEPGRKYGLDFQMANKVERAEYLQEGCSWRHNRGTFPSGLRSEMVALWIQLDDKNVRDELCVKELVEINRCVAGLKRIVGGSLKYSGVPDGKEQAVLSLKECGFGDYSFRTLIGSQLPKLILACAFSCVFGYVVVSVISLLLFWFSAYPHAGWRRLISVASPIVGIVAGIWWYSNQESGYLVGAVAGFAATVIFGILLVLAREVFLWIRAGFSQ